MKNSPDQNDADRDQLVIPSDQSHLPKVEIFVHKICKKAKLSNDQSDNLAIAITELVNNGIIHANQFAANKTVTVEAFYLEQCLKVYVIDQGGGFDPDAIDNPIDPENLWKLGGRGIFLVRNLIDQVEIRPSPTGTTVILTEFSEKK